MATALTHHSHHQQPFTSSSSSTSTSSPTPPLHYCKDCGVMFESSTSLEVHLSYHKENLLTRWATQDPPTSTTPSSSNNNPASVMESKVMAQQQQQQSQEVSPHGRSDQHSPPNVAPYFQGQYQQQQQQQYNNPPPDPPTTTASSGSTTTAYRPIPSYPDQQLYQGGHLFSPPIQRQQQQQQQHYEGNEGNSGNNSDPPPPIKTERPPETPAEILDLDSNKVHVYHLAQQQAPHGSFYRPYLMAQAPPPLPPPNNGGWALPPSEHFSTPFPQDPHHHPHHLSHLYGPPPPGSNVIMYDFVPDGQGPRPPYAPPPPEHQAPPPMGYPPQPGATPSFRGNFPPAPSMSGTENIMLGSPGGGRPSPPNSTTPSALPGKKGKKAQGLNKGGMNNNEDSPAPKTKGWKGGECKRPKTYNCVACNKWFTSSGHLKRHYGTTLHKNSMRQKGENPDDAPPPTGKKGKRASPPDPVQHQQNGSSMEMDHPLQGSSPRTAANNLINIKSEDSSASGSGKSSPVHFNGRPEFMSGGQLPLSPNPAYSSPYIHGYNGPLPPSMQQFNSMSGGHGFHSMGHGHPPVPFSNGFAPESGLSTPNIYSVPSPIVPTTVYNGGYPAISVNGEIPGAPLPPFSSVAFSHYGGELIPNYGPGGGSPFPPHPSPGGQQGQRMTPNGNGNGPPTYLHHGSLGPPGPGSPGHHGLESSYESESGMGTTGSLNRESPEAARSASTASGSIEGSLDSMSDEGSPIRNGSLSSGSGSGRESSEPETTTNENGEVVIKCPNCSKTFNRTCYLTQHTNSSHSGGKPFKCPTCGKRFPEAPALSDHVAKHGSNKPYKCDLCPKQFNHKTDLRRHLCLHTGEKPFVCNYCGKGFIRKDHMTKHCETHRKAKGSASAAGAHHAHAHAQ